MFVSFEHFLRRILRSDCIPRDSYSSALVGRAEDRGDFCSSVYDNDDNFEEDDRRLQVIGMLCTPDHHPESIVSRMVKLAVNADEIKEAGYKIDYLFDMGIDIAMLSSALSFDRSDLIKLGFDLHHFNLYPRQAPVSDAVRLLGMQWSWLSVALGVSVQDATASGLSYDMLADLQCPLRPCTNDAHGEDEHYY